MAQPRFTPARGMSPKRVNRRKKKNRPPVNRLHPIPPLSQYRHFSTSPESGGIGEGGLYSKCNEMTVEVIINIAPPQVRLLTTLGAGLCLCWCTV